MKKVLCAALAVLLLLSGCGGKNVEIQQPPPDSSRSLYFSETHALHPHLGEVMAALKVDQVLDHLYTDAMDFEAVAVLATVEEVFAASVPIDFGPGDPVILWVDTRDLFAYTTTPREETEQAVQDLRDILSAADSLVVHARTDQEALIQPDTPEYQYWLGDTQAEYQAISEDGLEKLNLPPSLRAGDLAAWSVLPIRDGALEGGPLAEALRPRALVYSLEEARPEEGRFFQEGDSKETVYEGIRRFVKEFLGLDQPAFAPMEIPEPDPRQEKIDSILDNMTDEELVGQLFFARCPSLGAVEQAEWFHLGGYLLFGRDFKDPFGSWLTAEQVMQTIQSYQNAAAIPMLIGVDEEGGTVVRVSANPQLREKRFSSPRKLYQQGGLGEILTDCREKDGLLASLGINVNFAPVADLSTDPKDFIYDRALGLGAEETSQYVAAVVAQMEEDGMGGVLKHFPGYGPSGDTHTGSGLDTRPLETFRAADFLPFQAGIEASGGKTAVLVAHNIIQSVDPDRPASLSPAVYQLLREEIGFDGPALTDDLVMVAITQYAEATGNCPAVLAIAAGADMVITTDFQTQIPQVLAALEDGSLSRKRVGEAAGRVLGWKYDLGLLP